MTIDKCPKCGKEWRQRPGSADEPHEALCDQCADVKNKLYPWCWKCKTLHTTANCPVTGFPPIEDSGP